jgi:acyl-ACP thioesterase
MTLDKELMPVLDGRPGVFDREWPIRMADIDRNGRLRLDAAARHIQDIGQVNCARGAFNRSSRCGSSVAP